MKWKTVLLSSLLMGGDVRAGPSKELIVNTPPLTEWAVFKIRRQLLCMEGVHFSGYDAHSSCLLLQYNPEKVAGGFILLDIMRGLNKPTKFREVTGYTIFEILDGKNINPIKRTAKK